ncbi:hypothetical protein [Legionella sp. 16cNR16C]|uniref:hypothetical protein n=1 Tax=Legionella sp. 16cNR16C TaxID=2905656 RepID=UPI001E3B1BB5|nr:hypothetical protein [Legionella sp. 16cNR16C]MCE3045032.1 hypothetical protein [Legionella sp. 16cNR16C]
MMIKIYNASILVLLFILSPFAFSQPGNTEENWKCRVYDQTKKEWLAVSNYELTALNKAFDSCKKESQFPLTCKATRANCDGFADGHSLSPLWQCTALDDEAQAWLSIYYRHRDDAVFSAKDYCRNHSKVPETCYVNLLTCRNINQQY